MNLKKPKQQEYNLTVTIVDYLKLQYPQVLYNIDLRGIYIPFISLAKKVKRVSSENGFPDLFIYEPVPPYCGLAIEIKTEISSYKKKDGKLRQTEHLKRQQEILEILQSKGYFATFAGGFDEIKFIIDSYLGGRL
jgi:hypothetical protein